PGEAPADAAHAEALVVEAEAKAPGVVMAEDSVATCTLGRRRLGEHRLRQQLSPKERRVEARNAARAAVPVDRRDLRRPPGGAVDDGGIQGAGRVAQRPPVERRPSGFVRTTERLVEPGQVYGPTTVDRRQPDLEIQAERPADLFAQETPERSAVDSAHKLADE